jgi:hypothetical protein
MTIIEVEKTDQKLTKSEVNANWILQRINLHDWESGGIVGIVSGSQGAGKTSVMLSFLLYALIHHPDEKVFWSNCYNAPLQFMKLPKKYWNIMFKEGVDLRVLDRKDNLRDITETIPITRFTTLDDLYKKAKPGKCNAVFFGDRHVWIKLLHHLRSVAEWNHLYLDEISEIVPQFSSGRLWRQIEKFSIDLKEARKCNINVFFNSQSMTDVEHRILTNVMVNIFMPGAHATKHSRISQGAIDNLTMDKINGNHGYLEYSGKFGRTVFKDIFKPPEQSWEVRKYDNKR